MQEVNITKEERLTLDDDAQAIIVKFVSEKKDKAKKARQPYLDHADKCEKAYHCIPEDLDEELSWMANYVLPWAYDCVESAFAQLSETLIPRNDQLFTIVGRTDEDHEGASVMEKYIDHRFDENKFPVQFKKGVKHGLIKNHICFKQYWRTDKEIKHVWEKNPLTGEEKRVPKEITTFNNVWVDVVDIKDFYIFPITGNIKEATRIHETFKFKDEIIDQHESGDVEYINLDLIKQMNDDAGITAPKDDAYEETKDKEGLRVDEAIIPRIKINDKVYKNYIATIVNGKTLIRFQPLDRDPYIWHCINPDGVNSLYGYGLLSKGLPILEAASDIFNQRINEIKVKLHGTYLFWEDGTFNPYNMVSRPAGLTPMAKDSVTEGNMRPLNPNLQHLQIAYAEVAELKAEFEEATGITKVVKGMIDVGNKTATEIAGAQNNSSSKLHTIGKGINDALKAVLEGSYEGIYERMGYDPEIKLELARLTIDVTKPLIDPETGEPALNDKGEPITTRKSDEELLQELPEFLPLPEVDVKMVGYMNQIRKQEMLEKTRQVIMDFNETPIAKYLNWGDVAEDVTRWMDLDIRRIIKDVDERKAIDKQDAESQEEQKELLIQKEMMEYLLDKFKAESEVELENRKIDLEVLKLEVQNQTQLPDIPDVNAMGGI